MSLRDDIEWLCDEAVDWNSAVEDEFCCNAEECRAMEAERARIERIRTELLDGGEIARIWVGEHWQELRQAVTLALEGAYVEGDKISAERAPQLAILVLHGLGKIYPDAPWQGEINQAIREFGEGL